MSNADRVHSVFELRTTVAECDRQIAELLAKRSRAVAEIHEHKAALKVPARDFEREMRIVENVVARHRATGGRYEQGTLVRIWAAIFSGCEHLEAAVSSSDDGGDRRSPGL